MDTKRICPGCQKPLPPDVPLGLCPECLIKAGFNTGTEPGDESTGFIPPPVEQIAPLPSTVRGLLNSWDSTQR
jgi:hypothetical protein